MQHLDTNPLIMNNAHYRVIVTFRGANFWHRVLMRHCGIGSTSFRLEPRKVTMNHIIVREPIMLEDMQEILCVWRVISSILP